MAALGIHQLDILRHPGSWKGPGVLAATPFLLAFILPLIAHILPEVLVPSPSGFVYPVDELVLMLALATGAAVGVRKGFPLWSYTWVVLMLVSLADFLSFLVLTLPPDVIDFGPVTFGWIITASHLSCGLLALAFAASRATLGLRYAFFGAAIYLAASAASPHIREAAMNVSTITTAVINTMSILIAAIMLAVVVAMVMRLLYGDEGTQRRSVYVLIAVALLHPILTGWTFVVGSAAEIANIAGILGLQVLVRWAYVGVALLITGGMVLLYLRMRKAQISNPAPSGGVDG